MENDKIHDYTDAYLESYLRALDKTHNSDLAIQTATGVTMVLRMIDAQNEPKQPAQPQINPRIPIGKADAKNHRAHKSQGISPVTSSEIKEKERNAMQEINEELENDRSVLEWMLGQHVRAKRRKKQLEIRLLEINAERDSPIGGQGYDPLPRSGGNNEGAAGILMKLADIEDRIYEQKAKADKSMVNVATILNFLPEESMEREICELRHIDGHEWGEIAEGIPMSKSQCHRIHKAAMYELLEFNYVKELVTENRESYEYYIEKKEEARYRRENQARKNAGK